MDKVKGFCLRQNKSNATYLTYGSVFEWRVYVFICWTRRSEINTFEIQRDEARHHLPKNEGKCRSTIVLPHMDGADVHELIVVNGASNLACITARNIERLKQSKT